VKNESEVHNGGVEVCKWLACTHHTIKARTLLSTRISEHVLVGSGVQLKQRYYGGPSRAADLACSATHYEM
jgi:hypothetical protein